jgi:hypothetical protein
LCFSQARFQPPLTLALALSCAAGAAQAQARPDPFAESLVAIRARRIETISHGTINNRIIVIRGGKITAVSADAKVPVGAKVLQADTVMPGIVGAYSQMGITNAAVTAARSDPHLRVSDELYPWDDSYHRLLRAGVTSLALLPTGRGFPGQGAVVRTEAAAADKMPLMPNGPLAIDFSPNTQTIEVIRTTLQSARPPAPAQTAASGNAARPAPSPDPPDEEPGADPDQVRGQRRRQPGAGPRPPVTNASADAKRAPVVRAVTGETPTIIVCPDAASVPHLLPLLKGYDTLKPVFVLSSADIWQAAPAFGGVKASVVLPAALSYEPLTRKRLNMPAIFAKAGAKVALRPPHDSPEGYLTLRYQLGELVKFGLDRAMALRAVTLSPAEMLGIADRVGSIDVGRDGNLILLDADVLDPVARVRTVLLEGRVVYEE